MKIFNLLVIYLLMSQLTFAQEISEKDNTVETKAILERQNEIRLGVIKLLGGPILEAGYEYVKNKNTGYGAYLFANFSKNENDYPEDFSLTPFYRAYFKKNDEYGANGFFIEGFTSFFSGENEINTENFEYDYESFFDISLGATIGYKWMNSSGFIIEIKAGAGRNLLNQSDLEALFKGDLYIGYRF